MTTRCAAPTIGSVAMSLVLSSMVPVDAQQLSPAGKPSPNVEIGAAVSGFVGSGTLPGVGLRVTGGNGGRVSLEGELHWMDADLPPSIHHA